MRESTRYKRLGLSMESGTAVHGASTGLQESGLKGVRAKSLEHENQSAGSSVERQ